MYSTELRRIRYSGAALALTVTAACVDSPIGPTPSDGVLGASATALANKPPLDNTIVGQAWVCKDGTGPATNFTFAVSVNGGTATNHSIALGTCTLVHSVPTVGSHQAAVSVTEQVPAGWTLNSIVIESNSSNTKHYLPDNNSPPNASARILNDVGVVFTFTNTADPSTGACTRTPGYWKNHAGNGKKQDVVTALLPIWLGTAGGATSVQVTTSLQAIGILNRENDASDGINKLRAHLLATKLNLANGADGSVVASTIAAADAFLATHGDWNALTAAEQAQVLAWKDVLDDYNNGRTGPGHCD